MNEYSPKNVPNICRRTLEGLLRSEEEMAALEC